MAEAEEPWSLVIGRVVGPFGTKGEVRVRPETDFPERFRKLEKVCLELPGGEERIVSVRRARLTPKGVLLWFDDFSDREAAESLHGAWLKVRPRMAVPLPEGSYYLHDIMGLRVVTEEGRDLGEITEVIRSPAHDVYVTGSTMIPAVRQVVREIDLARGRMIVALPPEDDEAEEATRNDDED